MGLVEILGDHAGAGDGREARGRQHRRGARRIQRQERLAPLPGPLLHQPQIEAVLAEGEPDETRMRAEWMMKQREHEALDRFAVLNKLSLPGKAAFALGSQNEASWQLTRPSTCFEKTLAKVDGCAGQARA